MSSLIISLNNIKRMTRGIQSILMMLVFPILAGVIAVNINSYKSLEKVGISNELQVSHPIIKIIENSKRFKIELLDKNLLKDKLEKKEIELAIILPEGFWDTKRISSEPIKILCNMQNSNTIFLRVLLNGYMQMLMGKGEPSHYINAKNDIISQRTAIGFFMLFILLFSGTCIHLLLEDKDNNTYLRYYCAPLKGYEIYTGIFITNLVLGIMQILTFLIVSKLLFGFDWKIPAWNVFVILVAFLISSIGISIGLISIVKKSKNYPLVNSMISLFSCFLGGAFYSPSLMGEVLGKISYFFPQRWTMQAYEKLADGHNFMDVKENILILLLFAGVLFSFGMTYLTPTEKSS